jgi:cytolethal distending toxin subunit B
VPAPAPGFLTPAPAFYGFAVWQSLLWNLGTTSRPYNVGIYWVQCDLGGNRNNVAIAFALQALNFLILPNPVVAPAGTTYRPAIGVRLANGAGTLDVYTLHAFSGGGGDAPGSLAAINAVSPAWAVCGDFNRAPASMPAVPGFLCPHDSVTTHPGTGTNLDYAFTSLAPGTAGFVDQNFVVSDHFPVYYVL